MAGTRESGGYRDEAMFIDRVIFPIRDARGRTVAFGGRVIPGSEKEFGGKYMNSGEFALFSKSRLVYGFEQAREAIKKSGTVVVTEGYMDCIAAQQCGIKNVVATLGTALTEHHVSFLKRFARKVVLVYDGDEAGRNAAERSLPRFLAQEIDLRVLTLPGDQDPADFLEGNSPEAFETLIETAAEAWQFKLRGLVERVGLATIDARHRVLREMLDTIAQVPVSASGEQSSVWMLRKDIILGDFRNNWASRENGAGASGGIAKDGGATDSDGSVDATARDPEGTAAGGPSSSDGVGDCRVNPCVSGKLCGPALGDFDRRFYKPRPADGV